MTRLHRPLQYLRSFSAGVAAVVLALSSVPRAEAVVVFDNLASVAYNGGPLVFWDQAHPNISSPGQRVGIPFMALDQELALSSITVVLGVESAVPNLRVALHDDEAGLPAASPLEVLAENPALAPGMQTVMFESTTHSALVAGTPYWVVLSPSTPNLIDASNDARYVWQEAEMGQSAATVFSYYVESAGDWEAWTPYARTRKAGLRVEAIPEPSTTALTAVGAVILFTLGRRSRRPAREEHFP